MKFGINLAVLMAVFFIFPATVGAQVIITEIMYDLEGTDSGREWIEVKNESGGAIDLTTYKFFENGTNHGIVEYQGGVSVSNGGYAVIADNPSKFLSDHSGYSGVLFDSSFSLSNEGETLIIKDGDLNELDSVAYSSSSGAQGDGNSLQLIGSWTSGGPTPGETNQGGGGDEGGGDGSDVDDTGDNNQGEQADVDSGSGVSSHSSSNDLTNLPIKPKFKVGAGRDRMVAVNTPIEFNAEISGSVSGKLKYVWTFGDGGSKRGMKATHTYLFPGFYNVVLNVEDNNGTMSSITHVEVVDSKINIKEVGTGLNGYVLLENFTNKAINIGGWLLSEGNHVYKIPKDTIINGNSELALASKIIGLYFNEEDRFVSLSFPNDKVVDKYDLSKLHLADKLYQMNKKLLTISGGREIIPSHFLVAKDEANDLKQNKEVIQEEKSDNELVSQTASVVLADSQESSQQKGESKSFWSTLWEIPGKSVTFIANLISPK